MATNDPYAAEPQSPSNRELGNNEITELKRYTMTMLVAGVIIGVAFVKFLAVRPLENKVKDLNYQLVSVQAEMQGLVGMKESAQRTNSLLENLQDQQAELKSAEESLNQIAAFRKQLEQEAQLTAKAYATLDLIASIQDELVGQQPNMDEAISVVDQMISLQNRLVEQQDEMMEAEAALGQIADVKQLALAEAADSDLASSGLRQLASLKDSLIQSSADQEDAQQALGRMVSLKKQVIESENGLDSAHSIVSQLVTLKDEIALRAGQLPQAQNTVAQLLDMQTKLAAVDGIDSSDNNLNELIGMQEVLKDQTADLTLAVESLELLSDFRTELLDEISSFEGIRRQLFEIAMLQTSLGQVIQNLEPLTELSNLRRLPAGEIRSAARTMLQNRLNQKGSRTADRMANDFGQFEESGTAGSKMNQAPVPAPRN